MLASVLLALTQGLGMNLVSANLPQIQGSLGATTNEATWLMAAYMAPNVSLSLLLFKIRMQFGLRRFAELSILGFVLVSGMHLVVDDLQSALVVRFFSGIAASPMSSLAFLYMLELFPPARKMNIGLCLALTNTAIAMPVARLISPALLDIGQWHGLYLMEMALALLSVAAVYLLPLTPQPRAKVISLLDVVSYALLAIGFGALAIVLSLGRLYWWFEAPWIGILLAVAIASLAGMAMIELSRKTPQIDVRWLTSREILHFTGALFLFRIVLAEQSSGAFSFFQMLGLLNDQITTLTWIILAASISGGLACAAVMKTGREPVIHVVSLCLIAIGAYVDSQATNLTRPAEMYVSQAMIAFASALFLPPALATGMMSALKKGPNYILSFFVVFLLTQNLGGLLGSAFFGTFVTWREKFHSHALVQHVTLIDPLVAQRTTQLGGVYARVLTDPALRNAEGVALLAQQATREANVLAYNDAFLLISALSAFALIALLLHMGIAALGRRATNLQPATT
ncbi:MFS transporter [Microvirga puerhi]|uniref:MFS transporter n=1 Tax=Microvirga puerhi TaxID=2876078 RepID=A0ABS7VKJ0_9HYPH|nr:MFS transporter [Microvirga puerhi]MBZ6076048.1 MFS transporter [Microvirga puerhi]